MFDFKPGRLLAGKYEVQEQIGSGAEGEVYWVTEARTGIDRAAKVFYPEGNVRDRAAKHYATKLNRLRDCPIVIQYHHAEAVRHRGESVTCLISDLVEGELLSEFVAARPGGRLPYFEALHLLHILARGLAEIHAAREYHGDIHEENVLVARRGIGFAVKLVDFHHHGRSNGYHMREDLVQLLRVFADMIGGRARYASHPQAVKTICCGFRADLMTKRFPTSAHLLRHLETFEWE